MSNDHNVMKASDIVSVEDAAREAMMHLKGLGYTAAEVVDAMRKLDELDLAARKEGQS